MQSRPWAPQLPEQGDIDEGSDDGKRDKGQPTGNLASCRREELMLEERLQQKPGDLREF